MPNQKIKRVPCLKQSPRLVRLPEKYTFYKNCVIVHLRTILPRMMHTLDYLVRPIKIKLA